jgi:hypothetical protein
MFLRLFLLMFISLAICIAPWTGDLPGAVLWVFPRLRFLWDQNALIQYFPAIAHYAANGAVRGIVSGLGLLNLWMAFYDAIHYRDR